MNPINLFAATFRRPEKPHAVIVGPNCPIAAFAAKALRQSGYYVYGAGLKKNLKPGEHKYYDEFIATDLREMKNAKMVAKGAEVVLVFAGAVDGRDFIESNDVSAADITSIGVTRTVIYAAATMGVNKGLCCL